MAETKATTAKPLKDSSQRSPHWSIALLVGLSRLILLAAGIAVGGVAGLAFAQFYPGAIQEPPLVQKAIAHTTDALNRVRAVTRTGISPTTAIPDLSTATTADGTLRITLPSDRLFAPNSSTLLPQAANLLNSVASELRPYAGSTIRVAGHTDATEDVVGDRTRSFEQAAAVQRSLENALGQGYSWTALGYGASRPAVENTTSADRQRNRRIEIEIAPQ